MIMKAGLYIHIPFCIKKCSYCDFSSIQLSTIVNKYFEALEKEIKLDSVFLDNYEIDTVFIGGGTPSAVDSRLIVNLLGLVRKKFMILPSAEITMEVNPGTIDQGKIEDYRRSGVNRISLGIQSFDERLLKAIGRVHSARDAVDAVRLLQDSGFDNLNGDFMFGLPGQSLDGFLSDMDRASRLGLKHISIYGLIIEPGTLMDIWFRKGLLELPSEDLERKMYHKGIEILKNNGYSQYEISNFSIKGWECKHNIGYWRLKPYLGLGLSAHSNIGSKRFWNTDSFDSYFRSIDSGEAPIAGEEILDPMTRAAEYMILGIRMNDGIAFENFFKEFGFRAEDQFKSAIQKHVEGGLLKATALKMQLTDKGRDLSNFVEVDFLP